MRDGLVVVDKPPAWTSHDVVAKLRGVYGQRRIGHAGTLDPDATGVLLVGLGRATRLLQFLQHADKEYRGRVVFGVATDTLDASGVELDRMPMSVTRSDVERAASRFVGEIDQIPPMVSALKVGGRKLYELARAGKDVERAPRRVHITRCDVESFDAGPYPEAVVHVECSTGTYIRSLAADLGTALGGCAHLSELRRLRVGAFTLDDATPLESVFDSPDAPLRSTAEMMRALPSVEVTGEQARAVAHGATFPARVLIGDDEPGPVAVVDAAGELLAVYERKGAGVKPAVVLAVAEASSESSESSES